MKNLISFVSSNGRHTSGAKFEEILRWNDESWEDSHDIIQWIFPLTEPSRAQPNAPFLSQEEVENLAGNPLWLSRLRIAERRFLLFSKIDVIEHPELKCRLFLLASFPWECPWLDYQDHNQLRISRVLRCLKLFGLPYADLRDFCLEQGMLCRVNRETLEFWRSI